MTPDAPVDRLCPFVDGAVQIHRLEDRDVAGLILVGERQVRVVPIPTHAEPLELLALHVHEPERIVTAQFAQLGLTDGGHPLRAEVLLHLVLDRLTVAVPPRHVRRVAAAHTLVLDDEVLEHLVVGGAHVDVPVGVRGTVVQHERLAIAGDLQRATIDVVLLPEPQPLGLAGAEIGAHRELRAREIHRALVVLLLAHPTGPLTVDHPSGATRRRARPRLGRSAPR